MLDWLCYLPSKLSLYRRDYIEIAVIASISAIRIVDDNVDDVATSDWSVIVLSLFHGRIIMVFHTSAFLNNYFNGAFDGIAFVMMIEHWKCCKHRIFAKRIYTLLFVFSS